MRYFIALLIGFGLGYLAAKGPPSGVDKAAPLNLFVTPAPAPPDWIHDPNRKTKLDATPIPAPWVPYHAPIR